MNYTIAKEIVNLARKERSFLTICTRFYRNILHDSTKIPSLSISNRHYLTSDTRRLFLTHVKLLKPYDEPLRRFNSRCSNLKDNHDFQKQKKGVLDGLIQSRILTIPNVLTLTRILSTPLIGYLVVQHSYSSAFLLFTFAGVTDLLDGLIARNFESQTSPLGSFLDPLADKLLITTLFLTLVHVDLIPVYLMALVVTRDVLLVCAGLYVRYDTLDPRPRSLREYFDPTKHSVKLQPTNCSKLNTAVQLSLVATTLASPVFGFVDHQIIHGLWYLTALTTVASGMGYIFAKDTFKYISKAHSEQPKH